MPLNKKKIQKENLNNPEDKLSMDVKDYEEFKKFRQEKMNLESTQVVQTKPYKQPFKQVNDFENKPFQKYKKFPVDKEKPFKKHHFQYNAEIEEPVLSKIEDEGYDSDTLSNSSNTYVSIIYE